METVKEKLAKLINEAKEYHISECVKMLTCAECSYKGTNCKALHKAEYLIQNGVTIMECGMDCKNCWKTKLVNPMQEWVSVDERLPEKQHDWVLTACKLVPEGYYGVPHIAELRNGKWWADGGDFPLIEIGVEVTHWMPLPAPPKGGCSDD